MKKHCLLLTFLTGVLLTGVLLTGALPTTSSVRADSLPADDEHEHDKKAAKKLRGIQWAASFEKALEAASKTQRPLLVDFEAEWCGWCKKLDRDTYGNEAVIRFVNGFFVAVKVDTDHEKALAKMYKVSGLPTILVLGSN